MIAVVAVTAALVAMDLWAPRRQPSTGPMPVEAAELKASNDRLPRLIKGTPPLLPAKHLAINPTIICRTLVGIDGKVVEAKVYQPRPELAEYERAALAAVRHFEFDPATKGGNAVNAWVNWPVTFADPSQIVDTIRLKGSDTIGGEARSALGHDLPGSAAGP